MSIGPGTRLGPYVVQEFIGQGAMGVVYRAYHAELERTGAVKVLQGLGGDADWTARFRREAQAIAHMRHPNVLNVFDFGEFEGTPYMIVEFVEGGSLAARTKRGPLAPDAAITFLRGIGDALDYAHKHGIVHRDVKPANVLLGPEDNPILADFGLAKLMDSSSIKSLTGVTTGTPAYMAPEQVAGRMVGPAADRYSLAIMAYEMLTGDLPFAEGGVLEVLYAQVHAEPRPPSMVNHDLPPRVDGVILRGMAKDPAARYERCRDFVNALEVALKPQAVAAPEKTVRFAPPAPVTVPMPPSRPSRAAAIDATTVAALDEAPPGIRGPDPTLPTPVMTWKGEIKPGRSEPRSHWRLYTLIAVLLLLALATGGTAAYLAQPPSLSLSAYTVRPGDSVLVTASHIPADQDGEIELSDTAPMFEFRADSFGLVSQRIQVPYDVDIGDHLVRICWGDACYAQQTLRVVGSVALASPTPVAATSATPGVSPGAGPGATPTARPGGGSSPLPGSSPTSSSGSSPQATPTPLRSVSLNSISVTLGTSVTFHNFSGTIAISVCQDNVCRATNTKTVTSGVPATFTTPVGIEPTNTLLHIGPAYVKTACCGITAPVVVGA